MREIDISTYRVVVEERYPSERRHAREGAGTRCSFSCIVPVHRLFIPKLIVPGLFNCMIFGQ